ncbi:MAG: hypothetical protein QW453_03235, partial [Thermoprotei archaeon]
MQTSVGSVFSSLKEFGEKNRWYLEYAKFNKKFHQSLLAHCLNVASTAYRLYGALDVSGVGVGSRFETLVILSGFFHDVGKYTENYQREVMTFVDGGRINPIYLSHQNPAVVRPLLERFLGELEREGVDLGFGPDLVDRLVWVIKELGRREDAAGVSYTFERPPSVDAVVCKELVHLADIIASSRSVEEAFNSASEKARDGRYTRNLRFTYHKVHSIRGLLTQILHKSIEELYRERGYAPIYWFPDATLYVATSGVSLPDFKKEELVGRVREKINDFIKGIDPDAVARACFGVLTQTVITSPEFLFASDEVVEKFWDYIFRRPFAEYESKKKDDSGDRRLKADHSLLIVLYGIRKAVMDLGDKKRVVELGDRLLNEIYDGLEKFGFRRGVLESWPIIANTNKPSEVDIVGRTLRSHPLYEYPDQWRKEFKRVLVGITLAMKKVVEEENLDRSRLIASELLSDLSYPLSQESLVDGVEM